MKLDVQNALSDMKNLLWGGCRTKTIFCFSSS